MQAITWLGLALALIGPGLVALLSQRLATEPETLPPRALSLALFVALLVAVAVIARSGEGLRWSDVGFGAISWRTPAMALLVTLFFVAIYGRLLYALLGWLGVAPFDDGISRLSQLPTAYVLLSITIVAAGEEWLYRGYAIERLAALTGSPWLAGLLSLLAFALVHLPMWGPVGALTTVVAGALFTLLYLWQRDIAMLMIAHVATDLYGILIAPRLLAKSVSG